MTFPQGLNVTETITIESADHLGVILAQRDTPVLPIGGGTCLSTGLPTDHDFLAIDMSNIRGIDNYVPTDTTASFQAGTPLSEIRAALAENGQELPIDLPPDDAGTIGGLVATGFSGPRRFGQGTLKDLIIGCEYVRGDGMLAKAGGMTVKNVSGFEISRLLHGSWGSLAVLTRINMKVLPKTRADRTLVWLDADLQRALDRQLRLLESYSGCISLQTKSVDDGYQTAIRFVGREPAVADYQQQVESSEGAPISAFEDSSWWNPTAATETSPHLVAHNTVADTRSLALKLGETAGIGDLSISLPTGTVDASIDPAMTSVASISEIAHGLWMIEGGDYIWKQGAAIWGEARPDRTVAASIKQQFDPAGILNRGRLFI